MSTLVASVRNRLAVLATTVADKLDEMDAVVSETKMDADDAAADEGEEVADITLDAAGDDEVEVEVLDDTLDDIDDLDEPGPGTDVEEETGPAEIGGLGLDAAADDEADSGEEDTGEEGTGDEEH
jgi:hypothetical protein